MRAYVTEEQRQIADWNDKIIGRRKRLKITQGDMAKVIGKSRTSYTGTENNLGEIRLKDFLLIAHELGFELRLENKEVAQ